ncbi:MAG: hypothetical protein ACR2RB_19025 [Gammaproteobacteria bacterium]
MKNSTMLDKVLAAFWILLLAAFMSIVVWYVNEPDLWTIVVACVLMGVVDFVLLNRRRNGARKS